MFSPGGGVARILPPSGGLGRVAAGAEAARPDRPSVCPLSLQTPRRLHDFSTSVGTARATLSDSRSPLDGPRVFYVGRGTSPGVATTRGFDKLGGSPLAVPVRLDQTMEGPRSSLRAFLASGRQLIVGASYQGQRTQSAGTPASSERTSSVAAADTAAGSGRRSRASASPFPV